MKKIKIGAKTVLYPMPAVLIGGMFKKKVNFMTAAWCSIVAQSPPAISVAIHKDRHTLKGIEENKTFSVNIPNRKIVKEVDFCGTHTGSKHDKSKMFTLFYGKLNTAPMIKECHINIECSLIKNIEIGSHILVIGEIAETYIDEDCLTNNKPLSIK
jgi:flavin reductase (DIM6/NTAB) family NADH-FMN oxidoreductase RutF